MIILSLLISRRSYAASPTVETLPHCGDHKLCTASSFLLRTSVNSASPTTFTLLVGVKPRVAASSFCLFYPLGDDTGRPVTNMADTLAFIWPDIPVDVRVGLALFSATPAFWLCARWGIFLTLIQTLLSSSLSSPKCLPDASMHQWENIQSESEVPWSHRAIPPSSKAELMALYPTLPYIPLHPHTLVYVVPWIYWTSM